MENPDTYFDLEKAAFTAWPALEIQDSGPWHLRFANGYTKRANSANALFYTDKLSDQHIDEIERYYKSRNCLPVFRLVSFGIGSSVDNALADRAYRLNDFTLVMTQPVSGGAAERTLSIELLDVESWFAAFQAISGKVGAGQATHLKMLQAIPGECAFAVLKENGEAVCCGLGVLSGGYFGLFDIATKINAQRKGLASHLCADLLSWGRSQGAATAYLQVTGHNVGAISVYEKLGFRKAYEYWYRISPDKLQT